MRLFNAGLETSLKVTISDEVVDQAMAGVADHSGSIGRNDRGRVELVMVVPATGPREAAIAGLAVAGAALGRHGEVASFEVMTTTELDARTEAMEVPNVPELLSLSLTAELLGITRQAVHHRISTGALPAVRVSAPSAVVATSRATLRGSSGACSWPSAQPRAFRGSDEPPRRVSRAKGS